MAEHYLTDTQLAARFGVNRATPWRWVKTEEGFPKPVVFSPRCTRWKLSEIETWEADRAQSAAA